MFEDKYKCDACKDAGVILVFHRTEPSGPYAFRCHLCHNGSLPRVRLFPAPTAKSTQDYARWTPCEAGEKYRKLKEDEEKKTG